MDEAQVFDPEALIGEDAKRIAAALDEPMVWLIQNVVDELGVARADALLQETVEVEKQGGLKTGDDERRRTPGGVYFKLVKEQVSPEQRKVIFSAKRFKPPVKKEETPQIPEAPPPLKPMPWDEARVLAIQMARTLMGRASVKITLVGRPTQVSKTRSCVVVALKGGAPPSLPRGLPLAPDGSDFAYAVFIAHKHWAKVAPTMAQNKDEKLVVEGYPIFDPKRGVTVVLAQSVRTTSLMRSRGRRSG